MTTNLTSLHPSTIEGIKRLAVRRKRELRIKHCEALDIASHAAGFSNFAHADRSLRATPIIARRWIFVTGYWHDLETCESGRETLQLELPVGSGEVLRSRDFLDNRHLMDFRLKSADHAESRRIFPDMFRARKGVCGVARALMFIGATGLRPYAFSLVPLMSDWMRDPLPRCDHASTWTDLSTGERVIVDEPYHTAVSGLAEERMAWARRHGLALVECEWSGMYEPYLGSDLFLIGRNRVVIERAAKQVAQLPDGPHEMTWIRESDPARPIFRSPLEVANARVLRAPADPRLARVSATTIPYAHYNRVYRRPRGLMPLVAHDEAAKALCTAITIAQRRPGVRQRLERVRNDLDDWVQREYSSAELSNARFFGMYYASNDRPDPARFTPEKQRELLDAISVVHYKLKRHYPECQPVRDLIHKLDLAASSAQSWRVNR